MIKISVIIPVYNTEKYIEECIQSVLDNDFKEFEVICVDDGSTDSSLELMQKMVDEYDCITILTQENKGQSAARNKALEVAKGKYVYFLDSDDKIKPNTLGELYNRLEKEQLDVLYFSGESFYESKELEETFEDFEDAYRREGQYGACTDGFGILKALRENKDYSVSPCIQILRKEFLDENQIRFVEGIIHEDNFFSFLVFVNAKRANCINDIYFLRRVRGESVMTVTKSRRHLTGYYTCLKCTLNYLKEHSVREEDEQVVNELIRALRGSIFRTYMQLELKERDMFLEELSQYDRLFFRGILLASLERERRFLRRARRVEKSGAYKIGKILFFPVRMIKKMMNMIRGKKDA